MSAKLSLVKRELHEAKSTQHAVDAVLATADEDESLEPPPLTADELRVSHMGELQADIAAPRRLNNARRRVSSFERANRPKLIVRKSTDLLGATAVASLGKGL